MSTSSGEDMNTIATTLAATATPPSGAQNLNLNLNQQQEPGETHEALANRATAAMAAAIAAHQLMASAAATCGIDLISMSAFAASASPQMVNPSHRPEQLMAAAMAAAAFLSPGANQGQVAAAAAATTPTPQQVAANPISLLSNHLGQQQQQHNQIQRNNSNSILNFAAVSAAASNNNNNNHHSSSNNHINNMSNGNTNRSNHLQLHSNTNNITNQQQQQRNSLTPQTHLSLDDDDDDDEDQHLGDDHLDDNHLDDDDDDRDVDHEMDLELADSPTIGSMAPTAPNILNNNNSILNQATNGSHSAAAAAAAAAAASHFSSLLTPQALNLLAGSQGVDLDASQLSHLSHTLSLNLANHNLQQQQQQQQHQANSQNQNNLSHHLHSHSLNLHRNSNNLHHEISHHNNNNNNTGNNNNLINNNNNNNSNNHHFNSHRNRSPDTHHHHHHSSIQTQQQLLATKGFNPLAVVIGQQTEILTPTHLRKAKLMFFYVRYPNSNTLKDSFKDVRFNKNNTAQLVKWFSNFREFYYNAIHKAAKDAVDRKVQSMDEIKVPHDHDLINQLNNHYNKNRHIELPEVFRQVVEETLRHFFDAVYHKRDETDHSYKKQIYKIIQRLDQDVPEFFKQPAFNEHLE